MPRAKSSSVRLATEAASPISSSRKRGRQNEPTPDAVDLNGETPSKRRRTRSLKDSLGEDVDLMEVNSVDDTDIMNGETPMKKPRSRPARVSSGDGSHASENKMVDIVAKGGETPSKRRRGTALKEHVPDTRKATRNSELASAYDFPSSDDEVAASVAQTPNGRKHDRPRKDELSTPTGRTVKESATRTSLGDAGVGNGETPRWRRNDRSARKKSARALIERVVGGEGSDEDDEGIARAIIDSDEEEDEEEDEEGQDEIEDEEAQQDGMPAANPTKRPRGRPKKKITARARKKSPTPPRDLPPHELYFAQAKPGAAKTSNNNIASLQLLTHEEYFSILNRHQDRHAEDFEFLESLHAESFPQWVFELSQGFSVCLYGYGSKRQLLQKFARHVHGHYSDRLLSKIVIINGYVRNSSIRELLGTVASAVEPSHKLPAGNPSAMLDSVRAVLSSHETTITIILNSIDAAPMRKPGLQSLFAQLAAHPKVQLICSVDTPDFTLLWDSSLRSAFDFVFHDCTTFLPFSVETDVVDDVHELLGRKSRRVGGKEGVTYVLRSLPENAKNLFRLIVTEVLVALDDEGISASGENPGAEYRMLYNKAVEEFICSSEIAFRTLLKEFHDHQMITSRKDVLGTELLSVPFRKEELEAILEDLMS